MSENNYLKNLLKSKSNKGRSPLEKFINKEDLPIESSTPEPQEAGVSIEHYGNSVNSENPANSSNDVTASTEKIDSSTTAASEQQTKAPLLKANGLREFDIDSLDVDSSTETTISQGQAKTPKNTPITDDEINELIKFVKAGNFDAAVDFIVQLKLKYNVDNIL